MTVVIKMFMIFPFVLDIENPNKYTTTTQAVILTVKVESNIPNNSLNE
jgi:hypothetical protein